ncbi:MAG: DUF5331 domain-containing protein [Calothrix sp. SM1_7_51]|nr:DUF5331 domain-containing protein [Calothrix sp. SM1_7_51]
MDTQQLRQSLKLKWINYYYTNRSWIVKMRIWADYKGKRRPLSGYILGVLSVLEPQLTEMFPFILDLNNNPDDIIEALGLNFNPEEHLHLIKSEKPLRTNPLPQPLPRDIEQLTPRHVYQPVTAQSRHQVVVTAKIESQGQLMPSVAIPAHFIHKNQPARSAVPHSQYTKSPPANSEFPQHNIQQSVIVSTEEQNKGEALDISEYYLQEHLPQSSQEKKIPDEVNLSPVKSSNIASWIDEFCPGSGLEHSEPVSLRF